MLYDSHHWDRKCGMKMMLRLPKLSAHLGVFFQMAKWWFESRQDFQSVVIGDGDLSQRTV